MRCSNNACARVARVLADTGGALFLICAYHADLAREIEGVTIKRPKCLQANAKKEEA